MKITTTPFFSQSIPQRLRWQQLGLGLLFSSAIALFAYRRRSLSRTGVAGALLTGTTTFGLGGWDWALALIFFFGSSSFFSHFRAHTKERTATDKFSKGSQRDLLQVAANGGAATLFAVGHGLTSPNALKTRELLRAGYTGALATATADTWATELGVLSPQPPRLITTGRPVAPGTSGGLTLLGTSATALGALAQGTFFWLLQLRPRRSLAADAHLPLLALFSGLIGSLFDSLLGATLQAMYYCPICQQETERRVHSCGAHTRFLRGLPWMDNDLVNFLATLSGSLVAMLITIISGTLPKNDQAHLPGPITTN